MSFGELKTQTNSYGGIQKIAEVIAFYSLSKPRHQKLKSFYSFFGLKLLPKILYIFTKYFINFKYGHLCPVRSKIDMRKMGPQSKKIESLEFFRNFQL